jgi:hypothetical protein
MNPKYPACYCKLERAPAQKDQSMGGRFGKYGDIKRKAGLRRSKALKKDLRRLKFKSRRLKKKMG